MMRKYTLILAMIYAFTVNSAYSNISAQSSHGANESSLSTPENKIKLNLIDTIAIGLRNNRDIQSAYLERISQKFDLRVAEDSFTPKMTITGEYLNGENDENGYRQNRIGPTATLLTPYGTRFSLGWAYQDRKSDTQNSFSNDGASFTVIQPLLKNAGKDVTTASRELARMTEAQNRLSLKSTLSHKITQIVVAYRNFLRSKEEINIAQESLDRAKNLTQVNEALIKAGRMARFEVVQTEADVANQELSLEEARNNYETSRLGLLSLLALDLNTPIDVSENADPAYASININEAINVAKKNQPAYLSQLIENRKSDINVLLARNGQLWDISLVAGASQIRSHAGDSSPEKTWDKYVGVQVEIPVGDLSTRKTLIDTSVTMQINKLRTEDMQQKIREDVLNAVNTINTKWKQYEIAQRAYRLTAEKVKIEREKLLVGRSTNFQIISYENDLRNANNFKLNASISYQNALTELDEIVGTTLQSWHISLKDEERNEP